MSVYSEIVMEHFLEPRCVGTLANPDGAGQASGDARCPEDIAYIWIRVADDGRLAEVRHQTLGCPVAIAASSMTCCLAQGKTLEEALQITPELVAAALGGVPDRKRGSIVAPEALHRAISDFRARGRVPCSAG